MSRRSTAQVLALVLIALALLAAALIPSPYIVLSPGPVVDVLGKLGGKPVITVTGAPTYPTTGRLDLTTVSESGGPYGRLPLTRVLSGWVDPRGRGGAHARCCTRPTRARSRSSSRTPPTCCSRRTTRSWPRCDTSGCR